MGIPQSSMLLKNRLIRFPVSCFIIWRKDGSVGSLFARIYADVYNMQLSNEPAEELAKYLVDSGKGAFAACGFVSGGALNSLTGFVD